MCGEWCGNAGAKLPSVYFMPEEILATNNSALKHPLESSKTVYLS